MKREEQQVKRIKSGNGGEKTKMLLSDYKKLFNNYSKSLANRKVLSLNYGMHSMSPAYNAPIKSIDNELNACSKCLSILPTLNSLKTHIEDCQYKFPVTYEEKAFQICQVVDIAKKQSLALLSKLFLKTKTLYYEIENFDFFIVQKDEIFGYFSRYKASNKSLNCFMVFPCFQGKGWGTVLLDYATQTAASSDDTGLEGAEKPYSKKAIDCFRNYWKHMVVGGTSIKQIADEQNMSIDDVILGLELNGFDLNAWSLQGQVSLKQPRILKYKINK